MSVVGWAFLELVHQIQLGVFSDLPDALGFSTVPEWWYFLWLVRRRRDHRVRDREAARARAATSPPTASRSGGNEPSYVPGIALAALATLGLGVVLGPEAPLIALGSGVAVACVKFAAQGLARAVADDHRRGRELRGDLGDLRFADRGGDPRHRGHRPRWPDVAARSSSPA